MQVRPSDLSHLRTPKQVLFSMFEATIVLSIREGELENWVKYTVLNIPQDIYFVKKHLAQKYKDLSLNSRNHVKAGCSGMNLSPSLVEGDSYRWIWVLIGLSANLAGRSSEYSCFKQLSKSIARHSCHPVASTCLCACMCIYTCVYTQTHTDPPSTHTQIVPKEQHVRLNTYLHTYLDTTINNLPSVAFSVAHICCLTAGILFKPISLMFRWCCFGSLDYWEDFCFMQTLNVCNCKRIFWPNQTLKG